MKKNRKGHPDKCKESSSKAGAVHGASSKPTMSHAFEKFCLTYSTSMALLPLREFLLSFWNISVLIQKVSSQILSACVKSNYVLRGNMIKLQFDFECLFLPRPVDSFPLQKTQRLTEQGLEAFLLCHFYLWGELSAFLKFTKSVAVCMDFYFYFFLVQWFGFNRLSEPSKHRGRGGHTLLQGK